LPVKCEAGALDQRRGGLTLASSPDSIPCASEWRLIHRGGPPKRRCRDAALTSILPRTITRGSCERCEVAGKPRSSGHRGLIPDGGNTDSRSLHPIMAGLVPVTPVFTRPRKTGMAGTGPAMTDWHRPAWVIVFAEAYFKAGGTKSPIATFWRRDHDPSVRTFAISHALRGCRTLSGTDSRPNRTSFISPSRERTDRRRTHSLSHSHSIP
jgi:hypothetical protein